MIKSITINMFLKVVSYVGVFLGGVAMAYGKGWVTDHFKQRGEKRKKIEGFMGKVTDVVADSTASGYKDYPTGSIKSKMNRASAQLERLGQVEMSKTIRKYVGRWVEYNSHVVTATGGNRRHFDEARVNELRHELDELTDEILG